MGRPGSQPNSHYSCDPTRETMCKPPEIGRRTQTTCFHMGGPIVQAGLGLGGGVTPGIAREVRATAWFTLHSVFENGESLYIVLGVVFCYNTSRTIPPACSAACNMGASDIMDSAPFPHQQHRCTNRGGVNSGWPMSILRARPFRFV